MARADTAGADPAGTGTRRLLGLDFVLCIILMMLSIMSMTVMTPVLPPYLSGMGATEWVIGLSVGLYSITGLLSRPLGGYLSDRALKKWAMLAGAAIFLVINLLYVPQRSVLAILVLRALHGLGNGLYFPSIYALVSELVPPERRGEGMGWFGVGPQVAMGFGPVIGLTIARWVGPGGVFVFAALLAGVTLVLVLPLREPAVDRSAPARLYTPRAVLPSVGQLLVVLVYGGTVAFLPLLALARGLTHFGWYFTTFAMTTLLFQVHAGRVSDRLGRSLTVASGAVLVAVSTVFLGVVQHMWALLGTAAVFGTGLALVRPSLQALLIDQTSPDERGAAMAMFTASFDSAVGLGGIVSGTLLGVMTYENMFAVMAAFPLATAVIHGTRWRRGPAETG